MKVILREAVTAALGGALLLPNTGTGGTQPTSSAEAAVSIAATTVERKDPPPDQKCQMRLLVWNFWSGQCTGSLDGPAGQAQATDLIKGHDVDDAGNVYWTECEAPVIRCPGYPSAPVVIICMWAAEILSLSGGLIWNRNMSKPLAGTPV